MNQHTCEDCDHHFFDAGQSQDSISPAVQCPQCHSYKTQPSGIPDEANDMVHGIGAMPTSTQDDMSGNPLQEGILGDGGFQNRDRRDESFSSVRKRSDFPSLFESPEFETTQLNLPQELYQHGMQTEATHRTNIQLPKGITDNLHATLGNLHAWVENPYENGQLRPYYNKYWKSIRPEFMKPGSLQIGVADPPMAEIINHVAQTDDMTPLYQYRGHTSSTRIAIEAVPELVAGAEDLAGGGSAGGIGGLLKSVTSPITDTLGKIPGVGLLKKIPGVGQAAGMIDDVLGMGGGGGMNVQPQTQDSSFYSRIGSDEDDMFPDSHDEIPKNEDGDAKQKDDGNSHEWQRDLSVNDGGGTDHSPSFDPGGPAMQRFHLLAPLLLQYLESGEDGSQDPLIQGLHESLEAEIPGYQDHADEQAMQALVEQLKGGGEKGKPEHNEPDHTDENSGGKHEARYAGLRDNGSEAGDFLPDFEVTFPDLYRPARTAMMPPPPGGGAPPMGGPPPGAPPMAAAPAPAPPPQDSSQGPVTDEQQSWFASWLEKHGRADEIPKMIANPQLYAKDFATARGRGVPPQSDDGDAGLSSNPPMPAQENAPPGDTMPVPGMQAGPQMMSAVERYSADSVADECPNCGSHTTGIIDEEGTKSQCHGCHTIFDTKGNTPNTIHSASTWNVDEDFRKEAMGGELPSAADAPAPAHHHQPDSGHTWTDEAGSPLQVGQEYEMSSAKYTIPDQIRIDAVKPGSIVYTIAGELGLDHSSELTKEEADLEQDSFKPVAEEGDGQTDDSFEQNNDDNTGYKGEPEQSDMSAPHGMATVGALTFPEEWAEGNVVTSGVAEQRNPKLAWLHEGGASFTPMEQRALIDEQGSARNADRLDLLGTHYIQDADDDQFLFGI